MIVNLASALAVEVSGAEIGGWLQFHVALDAARFGHLRVVEALGSMAGNTRQQKRIVMVLAAYDVLLVAAILLLEWHYAVDIIGGIAVAIAAIALVDGREFWMWMTRRAEP